MITAFLRWVVGRQRPEPRPRGRDLACIGGPLDGLSLWLDYGALGFEVWKVDGSYHVLPGFRATEDAGVLTGRYLLVHDRESGTEWLQYREAADAPQVN